MTVALPPPSSDVPLVSVVVPTYGHARYVRACLDSLFAQAWPALEVIVVDDGSPDDTAELLAPLARAGAIRYVRQANAGQAAARNHGAALARGEYLTFLDDDDLLLEDAIAWRVRALAADATISMVYGAPIVFSGDPPVVPRGVEVRRRRVHHATFQVWNRIWSPGQVLMRRRDFERAGGFDARVWGTDDWDLWLRLLELGPACASSQPVLAHRRHPHNASRDVARMYDSSLRVARRHLRRAPVEARPVLRKMTYLRLRRWHAPRLATMVRQAMADRAWRRAATAARSWLLAWSADALAQVLLKGHLLRSGHWHLPLDLVPAHAHDDPDAD